MPKVHYTREEFGYIYCITNNGMPNMVKIGMTTKSPDKRLLKANKSDTWKSPYPFVIEFAKKVRYPYKREQEIHKFLEGYNLRINDREFFNVSPNDVLQIFNQIEGKMWSANDSSDDEDIFLVESMDTGSEDEEISSEPRRLNRHMTKCFEHGQTIRHIFRDNVAHGIYDSSEKAILYNDIYYNLSEFVYQHYYECGINIIPSSVKPWNECECWNGYIWISTYNLPVKK